MTCEICRESLGLVVEQDLASHPELRAHLESCSKCRSGHASLVRARNALISFAPVSPRIGEAFTQAVLVRARRESRLQIWRRWGALAAASVLLMIGLGLGIETLSSGLSSPTGFRVIRAASRLEEPYRPGSPLNPGDMVVADRGGSLPASGRLVGMGPGGVLWMPQEWGGERERTAGREGAPVSGRPVLAFSDDRSVQVISDPAGIVWTASPGQRRRYLHELVELSEGQDLQLAELARGELKRVLGPDKGVGDLGQRRQVSVEADAEGEILPDGTGTVLFPVVERSALALGGPRQGISLGTVSRAFVEVVGLVGDRFLPGSFSRMLRAEPEGI